MNIKQAGLESGTTFCCDSMVCSHRKIKKHGIWWWLEVGSHYISKFTTVQIEGNNRLNIVLENVPATCSKHRVTWYDY